MKYALRIASREYGEHVRTRGFIIGLLLFPLMLYAGMRAPALLEKFAKPSRAFAVIDASGDLLPVIDAAVERDERGRIERARGEWEAKRAAKSETPDFVPPEPKFVRVELPAAAAGLEGEAAITALKPYLTGDSKVNVGEKERELFALIVLPKERSAVKKKVQYWSTNLTDDDLPNLVSKALEDDLRRAEYTTKGIAQDEVERIARIDVSLDNKDPRRKAGEEDVGLAEKLRQWAPVAFVYLMFVAMMTVAQMLLSSTIEEKASRIVEVLLSSVTPGELMLGKLLGVCAVAFTMLTAWMLALFIVLRWFSGGASEFAGPLMSLVFTPQVLLPLIAYFLLGFLLYSSLLLALGSLCNTLKEAQNFMGPVMMVLMVPLVSMIFVAKDPNGPLARTLSWIPPFTPFTMMNRIAGEPAGWEIAGTLALLVVSVVLMLWLAGRIFRNGVLHTGAPPKFVEIFRLLRKAS